MLDTQPLVTGFLDYSDGETVLEAYVAHRATPGERRPCILVAHDWSGQNASIRTVTENWARLGYIGVALDVYGKGVRGGETDDNSALMAPYIDDRKLLRRRLLAAVAMAGSHPLVDPERIAVLGYCFGGLCALDIARSGIKDVAGVICVHGALGAPDTGEPSPIAARVLILHGWEDPFAPPADVLAVAQELTRAGADWQLHAYGHAMHSFTWPGANMPAAGLVYDATAASRAALAIRHFLAELFESATPGEHGFVPGLSVDV